MAQEKYKYFSAADSARTSRLSFIARQVVEGVITGLHKSPHRGFSVEFSEHREYAPGDEIRHLDWKVYARADRYYVKLYEQETNLRAMLVLDTSSSMQYGNKNDYGRHLCACLAYLLAHQQDQVGLITLDSQIRSELPPATSAAHLDRLFKGLEEAEPDGRRETNLAGGLHQLAERLPRRSQVILVSDLWIEPAAFAKALQHLRYRRHQGMVIHLLDHTEVEFDYDRQITLQDLETGEKLQVNPSDLREAYKTQVADYLNTVRRCCSDCDVEYHPIYVQQPYDKALLQLINRRS
ncbi:MAG: DUF58 domain-containing protein [Tepidisphaeraceae bacterium]|jgi:uncharacterized protein (DUF58 family)